MAWRPRLFQKPGRIQTGALLLAALLTVAAGVAACTSDQPESPPATADAPRPPEEAGAPLVTLRHWKESTPSERYSFLIGFVTMLELEKEWQGKDGRALLPFDQSLTGSWVRGFENRPLNELYNGLNQYLAAHPGDLKRPVAEVMWFLFVQPRLDDKKADGD